MPSGCQYPADDQEDEPVECGLSEDRSKMTEQAQKKSDSSGHGGVVVLGGFVVILLLFGFYSPYQSTNHPSIKYKLVRNPSDANQTSMMLG